MVLVADTGPLVAALNRGDPDHRRCAALIKDPQRDVVLPALVLVEIDYWLRKLGAGQAWARLVEDLIEGLYRLEPLTVADLARAVQLEQQYADLRLGLVDASVIALCERLELDTVATLDHRHFSVVRPRHCSSLRLLPD